MRTNSSLRRTLILYVLPGALLTLFLISSFQHLSKHTQNIKGTVSAPIPQFGSFRSNVGDSSVGSVSTDELLTGKAIAPKLGNETAKAELGRAAWKLFHTTFARFPDKPTKEESEALRTYLGLFQRLYPWYVYCLSHIRLLCYWRSMLIFTSFTAANVQPTSVLFSTNSLPKFPPVAQPPPGAVMSTTKSIRA
jgi:hypothetical protein